MNIEDAYTLSRRALRLGMKEDRLADLLSFRGWTKTTVDALLGFIALVDGGITLTEALAVHGYGHRVCPSDPMMRRQIYDATTLETVWHQVDHALLVWPWLAAMAVDRANDKAKTPPTSTPL